jgi:hypothetical protein
MSTQEVSICNFCGEIKPVMRKYLHAKNTAHIDTNKQTPFTITSYCNDCKLEEDEKEIVICSAVKADDGMIYRGHRHNNCINLIREVKKMPKEQGFITSKNRFVDRKEGLRLQLEAGIKSVSGKGYSLSLGELFSEDLY